MSLIRISRAESGDVDSVNSLTGALTLVGISGVSISDDGSTTITISQSDIFFTPVDARAVTGHISPNADETYDLGNAGLNFRDVRATSGVFDEAVINGVDHSTLPPILYAIQTSGGPVDARAVTGHISPNANVSYDIGTTSLRMRKICGQDGEFSSKIQASGNLICNDVSHRTYLGLYCGGTPVAGSEGTYCTFVGEYAGYQANQNYGSAFGVYAGYLNTGTQQSAFGVYAGRSNTGAYQSAFGVYAGYLNTGAYQSAFGYYTGRFNTGSSHSAFGYQAGQYNNGSNNTAIGYDSFNTWTDNTGAAKTCTSGNFTVATQQVVVTGHSFGSAGTYVNLKISTNGVLPAGLDAGIDQWKIIGTNTLQVISDSFTDGGSGVHTLTPPVTYSNSTALGYDAEPTASNQVMLGDANVTEVKTKGKYTTSAAIVEARIEAHTVTEPRFVPSVTSSGLIGSRSLKWREVNATSGIFNRVSSPVGESLYLSSDTATYFSNDGGYTQYLKVYRDGSRSYISDWANIGLRLNAGGAIELSSVDAIRFWAGVPTNVLDIDGYNADMHTFRPLTSMSGVLGDRGHIWNLGFFDNVLTNKIFANTGDTISVSGNLHPATDNAYDIGTPSLKFRNVHAASGIFDNIAGASPITVHDNLVPSSDLGVDLGHAGARFGTIHATSGSFANSDMPVGRVGVMEASGIMIQTIGTDWVDVVQFNNKDTWGDIAVASGGGGTGHIQTLTAGVYLMSLGLTFESTKNTPYECAVFKNGSESFRLHKHSSATSEWMDFQHSHAMASEIDDYYNLKIRVTTGEGKTFDVHHGEFHMIKVR